ncbi:MAG: hypothetical protein COA42_14715 [Alteromonadaceae bacterium]|nr:MAG: hypothetical protein COA42_14715 [Alteromonadaceae bacterium]
MAYLISQGENDFVELGNGIVLTKLVKSAQRDFETRKTAVKRQSAAATSLTTTQAPTTAEQIEVWNKSHVIGASVKVPGYQGELMTRTKAMLLFGHRAGIYIKGYHGYFNLNNVAPA